MQCSKPFFVNLISKFSTVDHLIAILDQNVAYVYLLLCERQIVGGHRLIVDYN